MAKALVAFLSIFIIGFKGNSQDGGPVQPATFGIHFVFVDFKTAAAIRATSLSTVLANHEFGKLKDMSQGLAISYGKGLSAHYDFTSTLLGSILAYPGDDGNSSDGEFPLLEMDACIRGKMFSDKSWFVPYVQAGVGFSKYQGYWNAFIPAGLGLQIGFFGEAYLRIDTQYRIAVTESAKYHFVHSIGLVGNIGK